MSGGERPDVEGPKRFEFPAGRRERLTHYLFRYPAKFHPPALRHLIQRYTCSSATVLDPFCGSGTLLVEAGVCGRSAIGIDVDPLAVFVSNVKAHRYCMTRLRRSCGSVLRALGELARSEREYERRKFVDIMPETVARTVRDEELWVPAIPNIYHWFRRYVVVDLGRILRCIRDADVPGTHRDFLVLCFASMLRACSNADPVPVSGLEVTSYMRQKDVDGRLVNPFHLFGRTVARGLDGVDSFQERVVRHAELSAKRGDATRLPGYLRERIDVVITSPPYNSAVDYYRRHLLEMYWLGFTESQEDRLRLLPRYIGRGRVRQGHPYVARGALTTPLIRAWEADIRRGHRVRADAFKHYVVAMGKAVQEIRRVLKPGGQALFVVGQSGWNGRTIPTDKLFVELAGTSMRLRECLWYPVVNRYMSYSRRNRANIDKEHVLVFEKP